MEDFDQSHLTDSLLHPSRDNLWLFAGWVKERSDAPIKTMTLFTRLQEDIDQPPLTDAALYPSGQDL